MDTEFCITCRGDDFVEFKSEGDLVCRKCGTVKESRLIDERSEWRTFSDKDKDTTDPNRVGGPTNHLLEGLTTTIGRERNDGGLSYALNRIHARTNNPDRLLVNAFKEVGRMCDLLGVRGAVKDRACEIYKEVVEAKSLKGRSVKALAASCLFWACRQEKQPRTFKEIVSCLGNDVSKKEIGRTFKDLQQLKKDELHRQGAAADALASSCNQTVQHPAEFVRTYSAQLRMDFKWRRLAEDIATAAKPADRRMPWDGRTPTSVASAVVLIAMALAEIRKDGEAPGGAGSSRSVKARFDEALSKVAVVSSVAEGTIRGVYKDLFPHLRELVPTESVRDEELQRLPNPDWRNAGPQPVTQPQPAAAAAAAAPAAPVAAAPPAHAAAAMPPPAAVPAPVVRPALVQGAAAAAGGAPGVTPATQQQAQAVLQQLALAMYTSAMAQAQAQAQQRA
ncbi:hypothetical protein CHLRE_06g310450v5 [Chlamydomonas reinhardtii]|uniref:General transcription factor TFIIB n=1 Tax=Chlamydomonas reinhardtii TaxID=3055 RepID=A0A2K3DRL9_CHLRE|nr:uncharacterized protein CHLRE_06g310450v5 [Chlamydomonas reinhardtii]PNW83189.1 hypothetical protein CHLRE_06g310450v5 [Chlamydomonas reinhardtii]